MDRLDAIRFRGFCFAKIAIAAGSVSRVQMSVFRFDIGCTRDFDPIDLAKRWEILAIVLRAPL